MSSIVGYTDLLEANGHNVTRVVTSSTPDTAYLNKLRRLDFWEGLEDKYVTPKKC